MRPKTLENEYPNSTDSEQNKKQKKKKKKKIVT